MHHTKTNSREHLISIVLAEYSDLRDTSVQKFGNRDSGRKETAL